ncbi:MAG: hydroxymethylbilane synthase [Longimicrobiales bacterium]|nr:hydroxymethylbilane synthase [Longimicrobiales bacterium]
MPPNRPLRIGTRGSRLALWQAHHVRDLLGQTPGAPEVEIVEIVTSGDRITEVPLSTTEGRAFFTKDIEDALLEGRVDVAVHSLKDLATRLPEGLALAAVLERADPRDALVSGSGAGLTALYPGARVGTSSLRRAAFVRAARPDLEVVDLRGNVPTRLARLDAGDYDAIVLASAGLDRLGLGDRISERLAPDLLLPAPAQGAIGLEIRADDARARALIAPLEHAPTRAETEAERALLRGLDGGCSVPIGALARAGNDRLTLVGRVATLDGRREIGGEIEGEIARADELGATLARTLADDGARALLDEVRGETEA